MSWLIIVIGPPKSGKTSLCFKCVETCDKVARVSPSDLHFMIFGGKGGDEDLVVSLCKGMIKVMLEVGYNVIVDLNPEDLNLMDEILKLGKKRALVVLGAKSKILKERGASQDQIQSWVWMEPKEYVNYVLELDSESEEDLKEISDILNDIMRGDS